MDKRVGLLVLFVLGASWACDARQLEGAEVVNSDLSVLQVYPEHDEEVKMFAQNNKVCSLCEEYTTEAIQYLSENKTQTEIIEQLHQSCSRIPTFKQQCITLVDYYAEIFFMEISLVQPQDFCQKINLCQKVVLIASQFRQDSCGVCHHAISEVLMKLKDPDAQLDIIELLMKGCDSIQKYVKKCKRLAFEYGPMILINAEQFLETNDVCTILHACKGDRQALISGF